MAGCHNSDPTVGSQYFYRSDLSILKRFGDLFGEPFGLKDVNHNFIYANQLLESIFEKYSLQDSDGCFSYKLSPESISHNLEKPHWGNVNENYLALLKNIEDGYSYPYLLHQVDILDDENRFLVNVVYFQKIKFICSGGGIPNCMRSKVTLDIPSSLFSKREWEIVFLYLQDISVSDIADRLKLSVRTVRNHIHRIHAKSDADNHDSFKKYCYDNSYQLYYPRDYLVSSYVVM